jgi:hypothetical protein
MAGAAHRRIVTVDRAVVNRFVIPAPADRRQRPANTINVALKSNRRVVTHNDLQTVMRLAQPAGSVCDTYGARGQFYMSARVADMGQTVRNVRK